MALATTQGRTCTRDGCMVSSMIRDYNSSTLRLGFEHCFEHIVQDDITARHIVASKYTTVVFYDVEITSSNEIEQLGAYTSEGDYFSTIIKTNVRSRSNPTVSAITPMVFNMTAVTASAAMEHFNNWAIATHCRNRNVTEDMGVIVLVAHNGMNHDHMYLIKTMIRTRTPIPNYRLADSLVYMKMLMGTDQIATVTELVARYAGWFDHVPHDAVSDANAIKIVVMTSDQNWFRYIYLLSTTIGDYMSCTGLSLDPRVVMDTTAIMVGELLSPADPDRVFERGDERGG